MSSMPRWPGAPALVAECAADVLETDRRRRGRHDRVPTPTNAARSACPATRRESTADASRERLDPGEAHGVQAHRVFRSDRAKLIVAAARRRVLASAQRSSRLWGSGRGRRDQRAIRRGAGRPRPHCDGLTGTYPAFMATGARRAVCPTGAGTPAVDAKRRLRQPRPGDENIDSPENRYAGRDIGPEMPDHVLGQRSTACGREDADRSRLPDRPRRAPVGPDVGR